MNVGTLLDGSLAATARSRDRRRFKLVPAVAARDALSTAADLAEGARLAAAAIDDGRAAQALARLARITSTPLDMEDDA